MTEKLKRRTIRLGGADDNPERARSAARLLRDVKGITEVHIVSRNRLVVRYNVRQITLQIIEALLREFSFQLESGLLCRCLRAVRYYLEDIECSDPIHDQAECTRDVFITRYLRRPHGCRDHRPDYLRRYL
ncbi:MAG: hypothetical protein OEM43_01120 [Gammaproteobacteria bacterium]|nr:hypothetical protein [Gammaproteobacteria bacterium]